MEKAVQNKEAISHYEIVGKSRLRDTSGAVLGPEYGGSRVPRTALSSDEEDGPFSRAFVDDEYGTDASEPREGVIGISAGGQTPSSINSQNGGDDDVRLNDEDWSDSSDAEISDDSSNLEREGEREPGRETVVQALAVSEDVKTRQELRRLVAADQAIADTALAQRIKADVSKGHAVKKQRQIFDSLLNIRIKLQHALIAANSFSAAQSDHSSSGKTRGLIETAEDSVLQLWNSLNKLDSSRSRQPATLKRKFADLTADELTSNFWEENKRCDLDRSAQRNSILDFWSEKCQHSKPQSQTHHLNAVAKRPLSKVLESQLSNMPQLVVQTQVAKACVDLDVDKSLADDDHSPSDQRQLPIYDDGDFYGALLQNLISQRSAAATSSLTDLNLDANVASGSWGSSNRVNASKKEVDTRASKGRKMRFTVHEKLQNFMAPEDRSVWSDKQCEDLFGSLFGRRIGLDESVAEVDDSHYPMAIDMGKLRLFSTR